MKAPGERLPPKEIKRLLAIRRRLQEWTIEHLKAEDEPPFDLEYEHMLHDLEMRNERAIGHDTWLRLMRGRIVAAVLDKDHKQVEALVAKSPGELAEFAVKAQAHCKRPRGRQEHDRRNLNNRGMLEEADRCVTRIRNLWERKLGIVYSPRGWEGLALQIAAEYCGLTIDPDKLATELAGKLTAEKVAKEVAAQPQINEWALAELINWRKNRRRRTKRRKLARPKSPN